MSGSRCVFLWVQKINYFEGREGEARHGEVVWWHRRAGFGAVAMKGDR
jgi:hypothetical protein